MACIHCGEGTVLPPEEHDGRYDVGACSSCGKYQLKSGLELFAEKLI